MKQDIRTQILDLRSRMDEKERAEADLQIAERLFAMPAYKEARKVYCYASIRDEVSTKKILEQTLRNGKRLSVPRVEGKRRMEFNVIRSILDLSPGFCDIPEPGPWCSEAPLPGEGSIVILPGSAFDRKGNRIGYGGGYYDSYLEHCNKCIKVGLAYDLQCVEEIITDPHDVQVDYIITEKEIIQCHQ